MNMLEIDVGNTRLKWRLLNEDGNALRSGTELLKTEPFAFLQVEPLPKRVRVSCVRGEEFRQLLVKLIGDQWGLLPEFAESKASGMGLMNAYEHPQRLGVDRWLAMLAARQITNGAFCVVDAGSALTMDFVDSAGQHLGGYIVPGLNLQKSSLLQNTAIRIPEFAVKAQLCPGRNTESAIHNGVVSMSVSWIIDEYRKRLKCAELILTGGDAPLIAGYLQNESISCRLVPDLVMDGLRVALP